MFSSTEIKLVKLVSQYFLKKKCSFMFFYRCLGSILLLPEI